MSSGPSSTTVIVPLRTGGKTRLSSRLRESERTALAGAMLADVAASLAAAGVGRILVAAEGPAALAAADAIGLESVRDAPGAGGLDRALAHAARHVPADAPLLVVAADLPCLRAGEVEQVLADPAPVVIAPTSDGGTGGLLRRPAGVMPTGYGAASAERHLRFAAEAGVAASTVRAPGFEHDVDTVADLLALRELPVGAATATLLTTLERTGRAAS